MDGSLAPSSIIAARRWDARLEIGVVRRGDASVAAHRLHRGPLRLQKPLHPEGPGVAHLLVVHPPAGIAGGDRLEIDVDVAAGAHALVTTPGAAKWYRSEDGRAVQRTTLAVARDACLEWLPQEAIVFDGADVDARIAIACERGATCIGWDIVALGRRASGERFARGTLRQDLVLACDGRVAWRERAHVDGGDALLDSPVGWNGHHVAGTLWAWGRAIDETVLDRCRDVAMSAGHAGVTRLRDELVVARASGLSVERVRTVLASVWSIVRPALAGRAAIQPRIWST